MKGNDTLHQLEMGWLPMSGWSFTDKEIVNCAVGQPVIVSIESRKIQLNQFDNISMVRKRIH